MNDLTVTVTGWVATEPKLHIGPSGASMCTFRLAATPRRYDRGTGTWVDGTTEWFTVRAFRGGAITIKESVKKGQPLVVTGRLRTNTWEANDGPRTDLQIDATSVGHDLTLGVAHFNRATGDATLGVDSPSADTTTTDADVDAAPQGTAAPEVEEDIDPSQWEVEPAEDQELAPAS